MTIRTLTAATAMMLIMAPAWAQEPACATLGETALWMGGSQAASELGAADAPLAMTAMPVPRDAYTVGLFELAAPMPVRVEARGSDAGDTVVELYDAAGTMVLTDDDSGGGLSSRAELDLAPGAYCLAVRGFGGAALSADLQVSRLDQTALTDGLAGGFAGTEGMPQFVGVQPCLAETTATPLGSGPLDGVLSRGGASATNTIASTPYYRFTLATAQPVTIRAENPSADPYLYVFDGAGNLLDENDDYESLNSRVDFTRPLAPGTYCIGLRALADPEQRVTVSVAGFDAAAAAAEDYALGRIPPPADGSLYPVTALGALPSVSVRDTRVAGGESVWFAMEIERPGLLLITADEVSDSDPVIALFDAAGTRVAANDDANDSLNSEMVARVLPGRYMLNVQQYSTGYQGVIRVGIQRFVPAP